MTQTHTLNAEICPVCNTKNKVTYSSPFGGTSEYSCPRCGIYKITSTAEAILINNLTTTPQQKAIASGWLRNFRGYKIDNDNANELFNVPQPTVADRANALLFYLAKLYPSPGRQFKFASIQNDEILGITSSIDHNETAYLLKNYLKDSKNYLHSNDYQNFQISPDGWAYLDALKQINVESQSAFIAMSFDESLIPFYDNVIKKGVKIAGYKPEILREHRHADLIDNKIIALIRQSKFVIADLTQQKEGVYYEAGYAKGLGLKVIWMCKKSEFKQETIHFDVNHFNFIRWEEDKFDEAKTELTETIISELGRGKKIL